MQKFAFSKDNCQLLSQNSPLYNYIFKHSYQSTNAYIYIYFLRSIHINIYEHCNQ